MSNFKSTLVQFLLVVINILVVHVNGGLMLFSVFPIICIGLINIIFKSKENTTSKCLITSTLLTINNLGIRTFASGTHDQAGKAWCSIIFMVSVGIIILFLLVELIIMKNKKKRLTITILFLSLMVIEFIFFHDV